MKTFDDYVKAVKLQYELEKNGEYGGFLLQPSPAQLRNLCLMIYDKGLSKNDKNQFCNFFQPKENEDLKKCIARFDVEKFKPFGLFFKGKSETTNLTNLEMIAVLVDFPQRPLKKFLKNEYSPRILLEEEIMLVGKKSAEASSEPRAEPTSTVAEGSKKSKKNKSLVVTLSIVALLSGAYVAKNSCFPGKKCMQWQNDHYEIVDCEVKSITNINAIVPLDKKVLELKKVKLKKNMVFFKYGKPLYYYHKKDKHVEFFNAPGLHPVTGKPLKEITWHMIQKYVK